MKRALILGLAGLLGVGGARAQSGDGPTDAKAQKSYAQGMEWLKANFPEAVYGDGLALAHSKQDEAAKTRFQEFVAMGKDDSAMRQRAQLYAEKPELARARMAPAFSITTLDGQRLSLDDLQGRVVLIDFWATWCGPCREALPHIRQIAQKFEGQPLVVLSVSLDSDETKWKDFVAKNNMTWLQYRDGGFQGSLSRLFGVNAIPHTFTIDADGVLQDEHIGDASIEGKLKKLCARARELQEAPKMAAKGGSNYCLPEFVQVEYSRVPDRLFTVDTPVFANPYTRN